MTKSCKLKKKKKPVQTNNQTRPNKTYQVMYTFEEGKGNNRNRISHNKHLNKMCVFRRKSSASVNFKLFTFQHVYFIG